MSDGQEHTTLTEEERVKFKTELAEMRDTILVSKTSRTGLIVGILVFLLLGKLGLTLAMVVGLAVGAIVYAAKKASLQKKLISSIATYDDERLRHWHMQAVLELAAAQRRSAIVRGALAFVVVILVIVWIVARVQR